MHIALNHAKKLSKKKHNAQKLYHRIHVLAVHFLTLLALEGTVYFIHLRFLLILKTYIYIDHDKLEILL
jgi:hypothetical protein